MGDVTEEKRLTNNEIATLLITEYDIMRSELRDYIKRYYSSIVIIQSIIFATIFTASKDNLTWLYLFVPSLIVGFAALMSLITFFISKQASYIKLIEHRLNSLCRQEYFIWETKYADQSLRRDKGVLFSPLISIIYICLIIPLVMAFLLSVGKGYDYLYEIKSGGETWFLVFSIFSAFSFALFPVTNKVVRNKCGNFNEKINLNHFPGNSFGEHLTIDAYGGDSKKLNDKHLVLKSLNELPEILGMNKLADAQVLSAPDNEYKDPGGLSGFVIIAESHISIHTFPKRGFLSADVYTCKNGLDTELIIDYFKRNFGLQEVETNLIKRGTCYPAQNIC